MFPVRSEACSTQIYEILLPWLSNAPLYDSIATTESDDAVRYRTPQRSSTAAFRALHEASQYICLRKGLPQSCAKHLFFAWRWQTLEMTHADLKFMNELSDADNRLINLACEQVAYASVKMAESGDTFATTRRLASIKDRLDVIQELRQSLPLSVSSGRDSASTLNCLPDGEIAWQWHLLPHTERLFRDEDVSGLAGFPSRLPRYVPCDLLQIGTAPATTFSACIAALRHTDRLCTLMSVQSGSHVKHASFLKVALLEHTFCHVLPVPQPVSSCGEVGPVLRVSMSQNLRAFVHHRDARGRPRCCTLSSLTYLSCVSV